MVNKNSEKTHLRDLNEVGSTIASSTNKGVNDETCSHYQSYDCCGLPDAASVGVPNAVSGR